MVSTSYVSSRCFSWFIVDHTYHEYHKRLGTAKASVDDAVDEEEPKAFERSSDGRSFLVHRYSSVRRNWGNINHVIYPYNITLQEIENFFNNNNIHTTYIKTHKRKEFVDLFKAKFGFKGGVATRLWTYFCGFDDDYDNVDFDQNKKKQNNEDYTEKLELDDGYEAKEILEHKILPKHGDTFDIKGNASGAIHIYLCNIYIFISQLCNENCL